MKYVLQSTYPWKYSKSRLAAKIRSGIIIRLYEVVAGRDAIRCNFKRRHDAIRSWNLRIKFTYLNISDVLWALFMGWFKYVVVRLYWWIPAGREVRAMKSKSISMMSSACEIHLSLNRESNLWSWLEYEKIVVEMFDN